MSEQLCSSGTHNRSCLAANAPSTWESDVQSRGRLGHIKTNDPTRRPDTFANSCFFLLRSSSEKNMCYSATHEIWTSTKWGNDQLASAYKRKEHVILLWLCAGRFQGVGRMASLPDVLYGSSSAWPEEFDNRASLNFRVDWLHECSVKYRDIVDDASVSWGDATELDLEEGQRIRRSLMNAPKRVHQRIIPAKEIGHSTDRSARLVHMWTCFVRSAWVDLRAWRWLRNVRSRCPQDAKHHLTAFLSECTGKHGR